MMTKDENIQSLRIVKRCLAKAHDEISEEAAFIETRLTTEHDKAMSREYGSVCRALGILEEQIASISNQLTNLK